MLELDIAAVAVFGLIVTISLGATLASSFGWQLALPLTEITHVHAAWGLGGWSLLLMAGVAYQISPRAILDVGYRYIDLGTVSSERNDTAGNVNPRVTMDDIAAHEVKVGLRYHFGSSDCCAYQAMK